MKKYGRNLYPKGFRKKYYSLAAILALNASLFAQNQNLAIAEKSHKAQDLKLSVIQALEYVENEDFKEEFSAKDIAQSNAQNIYDFLNTHSLLNITSNYGNPYTQNIDLRGFGQNGNKALAVIVDGIRLENIDSSPISLSNIPLDSIQKIEIIRGKGTTKYGNGAVSGILKITTSRKKGGALNLSYASFNTFDSQFFARHIEDTLNIGVYGQYTHSDGMRHLNNTNNEKDASSNKNGGITAFLYPNESLLLKTYLNYSKYDIKYANPIKTKAQFEANPAQAGDGYTHQERWDLSYGAGFTNYFDNEMVVEVNLGGKRNASSYINFNSSYDGNGMFLDYNLAYKEDAYLAEFGGDFKKNSRKDSTNKAEVDSMLLYLNGEKYFQNTTLNAGIVAQRVLTKLTRQTSKQDNLLGGELGVNYALNPQFSLFASYTRSFLAPNVDFMLYYDPITFTPMLNPHINTATFDTLQTGVEGVFGIHTLMLNLFVINGKDEAYYGFNKITGINANQSFDKTQRLGGEIKFTTHFNNTLSTTLSYAYVNAIITSDTEGYKNKKIPGVLEHTLIASLNYYPIAHLNLGIHYKYGSKMVDYNDYDNALTKSPNYQSLDLSASYTLKDFEFFGYVRNLTAHKNAVVVSGAYYPYAFKRTFGGGVKYRW